jgi:hypothetical protein
LRKGEKGGRSDGGSAYFIKSYRWCEGNFPRLRPAPIGHRLAQAVSSTFTIAIIA